MATLRDIKNRIVGVKNTQKITKAMKMVAAARLRRAQENIINARPYSRKITEVLSHLMSLEKQSGNPLLQEREVKKIGLVLVTSDRGLCGSFNMNIINKTISLVNEDFADYKKNDAIELFCVGKKGFDFFKTKNYRIGNGYPGIFNSLNYETAVMLVNEYKTKFLNGDLDKVYVVYNEFKSVMQQNIIVKQLLPILPQTEHQEEKETDYIFEPDKLSIINSLLPRYLNSQMWTLLLDSYAAELGARMTAMDMATENAKELIRTLNIQYNKERQATITTEILEIVSGANALKEQ
ncbi:MAG: ATP synthase F1 subunit gamma [Melioribacteraceae bacterium]|nr:ATP synthase F1 subunit gamma [Melioribacteraceae bacterium]